MPAPQRPLALLALVFVSLAVACESAPPPAPPRVVAPPEAPALVTPPPADLSICQRAAKPTAGADAATIASFETFSRDWIAKMRAVADARASATARATIRNTYEMELRATGSSAAPFVGVLSYCEIAHQCTSLAAASCKPASSTVVKEMFRYQAGKWVY